MKNKQYMTSVTSYREEQMRCVEILRRKIDILPGYIKTEYPVFGLKYDGKIENSILDVAIVPPSVQYKIAIRLMGEIHTKDKMIVSDDNKRKALELDGWIVIDFWYNKMPNLWSKEQNEAIGLLSEQEVMKMLE